MGARPNPVNVLPGDPAKFIEYAEFECLRLEIEPVAPHLAMILGVTTETARKWRTGAVTGIKLGLVDQIAVHLNSHYRFFLKDDWQFPDVEEAC